jgi:hypothetical protein
VLGGQLPRCPTTALLASDEGGTRFSPPWRASSQGDGLGGLSYPQEPVLLLLYSASYSTSDKTPYVNQTGDIFIGFSAGTTGRRTGCRTPEGSRQDAPRYGEAKDTITCIMDKPGRVKGTLPAVIATVLYSTS